MVILKPGMFVSGIECFKRLIVLIVEVAIIDRAKQSGYSEKSVMGYEGISFFRQLFIFL
jgi:hypothetical protein